MRNPFRRQPSADIAVPIEPAVVGSVEWFLAVDPLDIVHHHLEEQSALRPEDRNIELIDVLLEIRNVLTVPVISGRTR